MKAKIHAIAVIAAATMILTGCATRQQSNSYKKLLLGKISLLRYEQ